MRAGKKVWEGRGDGSDGVATVRLLFGPRGPFPMCRAKIVLDDNRVFTVSVGSHACVFVVVASRQIRLCLGRGCLTGWV